MNDAKFLGLCIVLAAAIVSATIVWSTSILQVAIANQPDKDNSVAAAAAPATGTATVHLDGPVTLAPLTTPIPVTLTNSDDNPVSVKDVSGKKWTR